MYAGRSHFERGNPPMLSLTKESSSSIRSALLFTPETPNGAQMANRKTQRNRHHRKS
eukprot:CAMPEP_0194521404 /NCGR_PEP_ID=MMETSP0253-20130528/55716_1 /TAXON_ID=2966 /ORGANISM="Noctiluca scintillans" /LENGTH=56 /DNA_ID=CAMNT_0039365759 /DNA_START=496 /DNA_END=663 /DNA_ORIENTATION=-